MSDLRTIPLADGEPRVETGPLQFGNDWPGLFVRGDDCLAFAKCLEEVAATIPTGLLLLRFNRLRYLLAATNVRSEP